MGAKPRLDSRIWSAKRVRDYLRGPNWQRANLTDNSSVASSKVFRRFGKRRYPLYVTPTTAKDMFDPPRTVGLRHMEFNRWELVSFPKLRRNAGPNLPILRSVAARSTDRVRRRWRGATHDGRDLWHRSMAKVDGIYPISDAQGPRTMAGGTAAPGPSGDEILPDPKQGSPSLNPPFDFAD